MTATTNLNTGTSARVLLLVTITLSALSTRVEAESVHSAFNLSLSTPEANYSHGYGTGEDQRPRQSPAARQADKQILFTLESGIYDLNLTNNMRVKGWRVQEGLYLGQIKVANRWGPGLFLEHRNGRIGVNYRGLQFVREL